MEYKVNGKLLVSWLEGLMVRGSEANWQLGTSSTTWWLILALILSKFFINYWQHQIPTQQAGKKEQIVEWLMHWRVGLLFWGAFTSWRIGQQEPHEFQQGQIKEAIEVVRKQGKIQVGGPSRNTSEQLGIAIIYTDLGKCFVYLVNTNRCFTVYVNTLNVIQHQKKGERRNKVFPYTVVDTYP